VAIFQRSLPFLQTEIFQTHVGTIHRRAIGPLALHNGTSAYTSLTRHSPAPTIGCLHRPPYKLTCSSRPTYKHVCVRPISRPDSQITIRSAPNITSELFKLSRTTVFEFPWFNNVSSATTMEQYNTCVSLVTQTILGD
jgi:hypothetical protein